MADSETLVPVSFERDPALYRHWSVTYDGAVATVALAVDPDGGLRSDYALKTNSYDLNVDIELADIVQRLRFEHPEVAAVVVTGGLEKVFCAGANIQMLASATHHHKVNFCKFTNETRNGIEDATSNSRQVWLAAVNGTAAGGGYELALACDEIVLVDDRSTAVSLPEVALLGVLPGTGGLTRLVDKRGVRRDRADVFSTKAEGARGQQALDWGLVDFVAPPSRFDVQVLERATTRAAQTDRPKGEAGVTFEPLQRQVNAESISYSHLHVTFDRNRGTARFDLSGPADTQPATTEEAKAAGAGWWPVAACRELDDAMLHLRFNEPLLGTWVLATTGDPAAVLAADVVLAEDPGDWFLREVRLYWARTLSRLDLSARTIVALIEPGSCFAGTLAELALAADRSYLLEGTWQDDDRPAPTFALGAANGGWYPMANGLSRLESRFYGHPEAVTAAVAHFGQDLLAEKAAELGLVTETPDELDWHDEVRVLLEERASFSADALTGLEANLRFVGPETMHTKIFARLTAWQNWIFQRPNASGPDGALRRFGSGSRPNFDRTRI